MKKYRVGHIGFAHVHVIDNSEPFLPLTERVEWVGGADLPTSEASAAQMETAMRGYNRRWLQERGALPMVFDRYEQLLAEHPDIVLVSTENSAHAQVVCDALDTGALVIVEKPLGMTAAENLRILSRAAQHPGRLLVNWPSTWSPAVRTAQRMVREGAIGKPFKLTYRNNASPGPLSYGQRLTDAQRGAEWWYQAEQGGGATLDYCCYGCSLSRWFFGQPAVSAIGLQACFNTPYGNVDDYGLINAVYPDAVAILEGSWTTVHTGVPAGPVVFGLEGTLVADWTLADGHVALHTKLDGSREIPLDALPTGRENLALEALHCLDTGEPPHPTLDLPINRDAALLLDAGIRSARSGKRECVALSSWTLGQEIG